MLAFALTHFHVLHLTTTVLPQHSVKCERAVDTGMAMGRVWGLGVKSYQV